MSLLQDQIILQLSRCDCASCGTTFGVPDKFMKQRRNDHATFFCPNGHQNYFPQKSEAERLRAELEAQKRHTEWYSARRDEAAAEAKYFRKSRDGIKGVLVKVQRRVKHGVCPCCKRTFLQLALHMKQKHPGFAKPEGA